MNKKPSILIGIIILTVIGSVFSIWGKKLVIIPNKEPADLQEINIGLSWIHEAQFAGLYVADQFGYYAEQGIKVNLIPYSDEDLAEELTKKKYDFVILQTDSLLLAKEKEMPIKAIFTDYKIMPTVYFSKKDKNIIKPRDLIGKTVGVAYSEEYPIKAMLKKTNISESQVNIIQREFTYDKLANDEYDVEAGWITDGDTVKKLVGDYNIISPADYGVNWYADIITAREDMINNNYELIKKFIKATTEGWQYAIEHSDEAALLTQKYNIETETEHLKFVLDVSSPLINTGNSILGWMEKNTFENTQKILLEQNIMKKPVNIDTVYTNQFIE